MKTFLIWHDFYWDDVRVGDGHGGWQGGWWGGRHGGWYGSRLTWWWRWPNFQLLQVAPPGDQIFVIVLKEKKCCCEEVGIVKEVTKSKNWKFLNKWKYSKKWRYSNKWK